MCCTYLQNRKTEPFWWWIKVCEDCLRLCLIKVRGHDLMICSTFCVSWNSVYMCIFIGSQAELCHLQVGDQILAVNGQKVADMSYEQWKRNMDEALQQGSLFMDIRRQGKNSKFMPSSTLLCILCVWSEETMPSSLFYLSDSCRYGRCKWSHHQSRISAKQTVKELIGVPAR